MERIWLDKIDIPTTEALLLAVKSCIFGYDAAGILHDVYSGDKQLWKSPAGFVVVTEIRKHPAGSELHVWALGGKGYTKAAKDGLDSLRAFAREQGCRWITGIAAPNRGHFFYKRLGMKPAFTNWMLEIDHAK